MSGTIQARDYSLGFTLLEVMVAMMVVAIALPALMVTLYRQADDTAYLRDKSLAQMVAANKLAELRLFTFATRNFSPGKSTGIARLADRDWYWTLQSTATQADKFFQIEVTVATSEESRDNPVYSITTFMTSDLVLGPGGQGGGPGGPGQDGTIPPENSTPVGQGNG